MPPDTKSSMLPQPVGPREATRRDTDSRLLRSACFKRGLYLSIGIVSLLVGLTLLAEQFQLDLRWSAKFYQSGQGWYRAEHWLWHLLNHYGPLPGVVLSIGAVVGFYLACTRKKWQGMQRHFLLIVLTVIIGPGLIVNAFLKDHWGRPRPEQLVAYGGQWEFRPVFSPGIPGRGKSFPSGDCAMGYSFMALVVFWKRSRYVAWAGGLAALAYGSLLGVARMAAGAHFPTDVLGSLGIVVLVIAMLYYWVLRIPDYHQVPAQAATLSKQGWLGLKRAGVGLVILLAVLSRRPYFDSYVLPLALTPQTNRIVIHANVDLENNSVHYLTASAPRMVIHAKGFAFPKARHAVHSRQERVGQEVHLYHEVIRKGYHAQLNYHGELFLPLKFKDNLVIDLHEPR